MAQLIVQKYGGKCLATVDAVKSVARAVAQRRRDGCNLVVVVSAMGQSTDELIRLAYQASSKPNRRELDMLLTTGERVSMALLSMALHDLGAPAISFTGSQAGVLTNESHSQARILNINAPRVQEALQRGQVVVLAGFQGVSATGKEITTLGRGGSDTTAVGMAAALKAERCEILKDVRGISSADPKVVGDTHCYTTLSYPMVRHMCFGGAKVLHLRAIELAARMSVPLFVGGAEDPKQGTLIVKESGMFESEKVLSVNSHKRVAEVSVKASSFAESLQKFSAFLAQETLPDPLFLASDYRDGSGHFSITGDSESLSAILKLGQEHGVLRDLARDHSCVTVTGYGLHTSAFLMRTLDRLRSDSIPIERVLQTAHGLAFFVNPDHCTRAIQSLHGFHLPLCNQ